MCLWNGNEVNIKVYITAFGISLSCLSTSKKNFCHPLTQTQKPRVVERGQAFLSLVYLSSSNIFALINYTGFATWVSKDYQLNEYFCIPVLLGCHFQKKTNSL